ncbi:MAG: glycyl-radical enzyme activating protein [Anaerolineae bacterium]|nr:glycyl-radical enzyme activating protein [Anaerolineae bacterium]
MNRENNVSVGGEVLSESGIVFNIQRFSVHDGPGIRTTVFMKGCSLHCFWCHNPEGIRPKPEIQFYPERCIGCGACLEACEHGAQILRDGVHIYVRENCVMCGACVDNCFSGALELTGKSMTVDDVMAEVLADKAFYEKSNGGITLSGGEPLFQPDFTQAILVRSKAEGLHTAIETCGNYPWSTLEPVLPFIDLVMMDIKLMDSAAHREATGAPNERILAITEGLMRTDKPVWFRTPVIPTVNDTPEAIGAIASHVRHLTDLREAHNTQTGQSAPPPSLELLRFHRLAADKYRSLDLTYKASNLEAPSLDYMNKLRDVARSYDIAVKG